MAYPKRTGTEQIKVRVSSEVADFLRAKARHADMALTELGGALLEYAAQAEANEVHEALVLPEVRHAVRQELAGFMERMFDFHLRTYMEAGTARRMVMAAMHYGMSMPLERIKTLEEKQWSQTWQASRKHLEGLSELHAMFTRSDDLRREKNAALGQEPVYSPAVNDV